MPQQSSASRLPSTAADHRPALEGTLPGADCAPHDLRIRAQRRFDTTPDLLFAAWTHRTAWESWLRLRARSRATLSAHQGGAFRLELAEGPTIHVITGAILEARFAESLSLSWIQDGAADRVSTVELTFRPTDDATTLSLLHRSIASRRHAAWLLRLWTSALDRLEQYLTDAEPVTRHMRFFDPESRTIEHEVRRRGAGPSANRGSSSAA